MPLYVENKDNTYLNYNLTKINLLEENNFLSSINIML